MQEDTCEEPPRREAGGAVRPASAGTVTPDPVTYDDEAGGPPIHARKSTKRGADQHTGRNEPAAVSVSFLWQARLSGVGAAGVGAAA